MSRKQFPSANSLNDQLFSSISTVTNRCKFQLPPFGCEEGWATEWQSEIFVWMKNLSKVVTDGLLFVIDYALNAKSMYSCNRSDGTLMTYYKTSTLFESFPFVLVLRIPEPP